MNCSGLLISFQEQKKDLAKALDEDKWFLSEKAHHDVGENVAHEHFLLTFVETWATNWREDWCLNRCPHRNGCFGSNFKFRERNGEEE